MAGFDLNSLLNGKSKGAAVQKQEAEAAVQEENRFEVEMLDVEDLMPSKDNFYATEDINELADAIELSGGIEQNLVVKPEAHGKYEVIAGHRRRLAILKLVSEGKEEYRKVPCRIKHESDAIKDKLSLILTNSTARELSDWEKVQQAKKLKELLTEYKKALTEENKDKPKEERIRMGRIREIVAQMLNMSTTQIGRMEAIENNLSSEFKEELKNGNIGISAAHELSRLDEEEQAKAYQQYEEKGEMHIKDVKQEQPKEEITDEQAEQAMMAIKDAIKGVVNRDIFRVKENTQKIEKVLRKHFEKTFKGSSVNLEDGGRFIYRFAAEGITIINEEWKSYMVEYADLAEIVALMIENGDLLFDDSEDKENIDTANEETAADDGQEKSDLPEQQDLTDYKEYVPEPQEKGLDFTNWILKKYGMGQYTLIKNAIKKVIAQEQEDERRELLYTKELEDKLINVLSVWVMDKTLEYKQYLLG